jgi:glycosyltransferase involved in cell wall biosynthesis
LRGYLTDLLRDAANRLARIDPLMAVVYRRSAAILCKTRETLECVPPRYRDKCRVRVEVGIDEDMPTMPGRRKDGCFRVLYAGRLVYWKGLHLGLMAFARLLGIHGQARLTVIGSGPDQIWLHQLAQKLGIDRNITWIPWLEREAVMRAYPEHDAFLFPSLHDSSGNVVLEALSCSLPVVCLDAGGPAVLVDSSCGFRIKPGRPEEVVDSLARALAVLAGNAAQAQAMGEAAARRARRQFSWASQAARMESLYLSVCGEPDSAQRPMAQPAERGAR